MCEGKVRDVGGGILLMRAFWQSSSAAAKSCFHWNSARALLMSGSTFIPKGLLCFSISTAVSNFSIASWYFCWSSSNSP